MVINIIIPETDNKPRKLDNELLMPLSLKSSKKNKYI